MGLLGALVPPYGDDHDQNYYFRLLNQNSQIVALSSDIQEREAAVKAVDALCALIEDPFPEAPFEVSDNLVTGIFDGVLLKWRAPDQDEDVHLLRDWEKYLEE